MGEAIVAVAPQVGRVLVVDDEPSIGRAVQQILADEGIGTVVVYDAESALAFLAEETPALIFLDIWLPGIDGLEALARVRAVCPQVPVVMISGHATIATALQATKQGAAHFLEKPLDLDSTVATVRRLLGGAPAPSLSTASVAFGVGCSAAAETSASKGIDTWCSPIVHLTTPNRASVSNRLAGGVFPQRTLAGNALVYGQGLHTGRKSGLSLEPLPPGSGIHFANVAGGQTVPALVAYVESTGFATTLKHGGVQVSTIEHLLSALHAFRISNLLIKCNDEVPAMDGSALDFCTLIRDTGVEDQGEEWAEIAVTEPVRVTSPGNPEEFIQIEPAPYFSVDYTLVYPRPLGTQHYSFKLDSEDTFFAEIAPARTFGLVRDIGGLQRQGLAQGGRFDNFVLVGDHGPINGSLRFADEFVRHKVLDCIGDLFLLGRPLRGKVTAVMTGHTDNVALLRAIAAKFDLPLA